MAARRDQAPLNCERSMVKPFSSLTGKGILCRVVRDFPRRLGGWLPGRGSLTGVLRRNDMKCPYCGDLEDKVVDSRESREGEAIRRRRQCLGCGRRFTSYERIDEIPYMVVKKDGSRERFDRQKLMVGLLKACEKRPVSMNQLESIGNEVESFVHESGDRERHTAQIGEMLMERLRQLDKVAYVRYASVYLDFKDIREFMAELRELLRVERSD